MEMLKPDISVIIPCRNEARFIERCLKSIFEFEQTEGGMEVIVVDGMSDDGTREILSNLQNVYSNLVVLDSPI